MEFITPDNVKHIKDLGTPQPMMFRNESGIYCFIWRGMKHTMLESPVRYGLQLVFLVFAMIWGIFTGKFEPLIIFIALTVILRGSLAFNYGRLYRVLRRGNCHYTIDKYGISLYVKCDEGTYIRGETDAWTLVKHVIFYKDFAAISMKKESVGADEYLLFHKDMTEARRNILCYWQLALEGFSPEELPDRYSDEELQCIENCIEKKFGNIALVGHEKQSPDIHLDLAVIEPSENRPYYTVCTIGAGAYRMEVPYDERMEHHTAERLEYAVHLPANWNVSGEDYEKQKHWWPLQMLKDCARESIGADNYFTPNYFLSFPENFDLSTNACGAYLDYPLPDPCFETSVNLPSGRTVRLMQVIPIAQEEIDFLENGHSYAEACKFIFDIDLEAIEDAPNEERMRTFQEKILGHFNQLLKDE